MELAPGTWVRLAAARDGRLFRVAEAGPEAVALRCPCCGAEGRATPSQVAPLAAGEALRRLGLPLPAPPRKGARGGRRGGRRRRSG